MAPHQLPQPGAGGPIPAPAGARYRYRRGGHELALSLRGVTPDQSEDVARGEAEFALAAAGPAIVLCYRFGASIPWSAADPFHWQQVPPEERVLPLEPELTPETSSRLWATLWITLTEAGDGSLRACRAVALRPEFSRVLYAALRAQAAHPDSGRLAAAPRAILGLLSRAMARTRCSPALGSTAAPPPDPPHADPGPHFRSLGFPGVGVRADRPQPSPQAEANGWLATAPQPTPGTLGEGGP